MSEKSTMRYDEGSRYRRRAIGLVALYESSKPVLPPDDSQHDAREWMHMESAELNREPTKAKYPCAAPLARSS
jgi:hypothetical protein